MHSTEKVKWSQKEVATVPQTPSRKSYHLPNDISLEELFGQECLMVC